MKFKTLEIKDTSARQVVMRENSEKETVLFSEEFETDGAGNQEFVIGLPLVVREWNHTHINQLAQKIRIIFKQYYNASDFAVAIHSKNLEDEVHFHISYNRNPLDPEVIRAEFLKLDVLAE